MKYRQMKQLPIIILFVVLLLQLTSSQQLCKTYVDPATKAACATCQPYSTATGTFCTCLAGYYMATDRTVEYCDLCHGRCKTCYGPLSTNCITCPTGFTFSSGDKTCIPPNSTSSTTEETYLQAYSLEGFNIYGTWSVSSLASSTYQCGLRTLVGGTVTNYASDYIQVTLSSLPNHFKLRIKASFYFLNANGQTKNAMVNVDGVVQPTSGDQTGYAQQICNGFSYVTRAVDVMVLHSGTGATVRFYSSLNAGFLGIRDVIIMVQKCATNCSSCDDYLPTKCTGCTDGRRMPNLIINGTCQCNGIYYQQPFAGTCVDPCPSVPTKYYGDPTTRNCVTQCPSGYFAFDDTYRCVLTSCPATNAAGKTLYRDYTNRKCVAVCPSTQPYGDSVDSKCYATCPSPRYSSNTTDMICVATCPHTYWNAAVPYKTYALGRECVSYCPTTGASLSWADPYTVKCLPTCTSTQFPYMDNSTGQNLCVASCPAPNRFLSGSYCVQICPTGKYGDPTNQQCTTTCTAPYWGLQSYNRKCVSVCPSGTWARTSTRTCVNTTQQCSPLYANDYSRSCVAASGCPFGTFGQNTTSACVTYCPNNSYGDTSTKICQQYCTAPNFRDPGVWLCVPSCVTAGLYADVDSTRTCVPSCNQNGATPWADDSTRTCVSDCNQTVATYLADNTTFKCVYDCPLTHVADYTTSAPKCVLTCPTGYFADATQVVRKICVQKCSVNPPQFGDDNAGLNLCVDVCTAGTFGDQTGNRLCRKTCPSPYFSQNDGLRRCVLRCNSTSFGYQQTCTVAAVTCPWGYNRKCYQDPHSCPGSYFGDQSTNLCVNPCPASQVTFGDSQSKKCVRTCPTNNGYTAGSFVPQTFYADISNRLCVLTCNASYSPPLFGSNSTRTCQPKCLDYQAYAQAQSTYRICVDRCWPAPTFHYANNLTKVCGTQLSCPSNYYGRNDTQMCVQSCPDPSWGYKDADQRICIDKCPTPFVGDNSTSKRICVSVCPTVPDLYADLVNNVCIDTCIGGLFADPTTRSCVPLCPATYFSYAGKCVKICPATYFADDTATVRKCQPTSADCGARFGDSYLRACVGTCTGPSPVNTFGSGDDCVSYCPTGTFADSYTGTRLCVALCPPGVVNSVAAPNLYGDPTTHTCVAKCITPYTWSDPQTRKCEPTCSATPTPTFSQNFFMTCVTALNCPTTPTMTFGDTPTRSCVSFCSNNYWGDPTSRNCVAQCYNVSTTGTSRYYGDNSTGQYLCVVICPSLPRLFGRNDTNRCVSECIVGQYGDQTGNRTCVTQCPLIGATYYYAQNFSRICVTVCKNDTWGLQSSRECVEDATLCGSQWADNTTRLCVDTCPASANLYGNFATRICVPVCPNGTFADDLTRTCVTRCPQNNGEHDTFGNNDTHICQQTCTQVSAYADPQTLNRYCVLLCSQSPAQSFADPSTKSCVPRCPTHPSLFGQVDNFKCVSQCVSPYYADTHSRRCVSACDSATEFKLTSPRACVTLCPSTPDLYGDTNTGNCQSTCTNGQFRYAVLRKCVASCFTPYGLFDYNGTCVKYCPYGYYADTDGHCVNPCPLATLYGQNTTTTCVTNCITGYAYNRMCLAVCPNGQYGYNHVCSPTCPSGTASNVTNLCVGTCDAGTYNQNGICVSVCTTLYADPNTRLCTSSCTLNRYADIFTHRCVQVCSAGYYRDPSYVCKSNCAPLLKDTLTGTCTSMCSNGTWGYNNDCVTKCPPLFYGYQVDRNCYNIANIPDPALFTDNITQTWTSVCTITPLRFGDRQSHECVVSCSASNEYTDPQSRQCETACTNTSFYLDPTTKACVLICPPDYHSNPINNQCQQNCTHSLFDYDPTHSCVGSCPLPYYGYHNSTELVCVLVCPSPQFAEGDLCKNGCTPPLLADTPTRKCVANCVDSYASTDAVACVAASVCATYGKKADNSTNQCVGQCPSDPDYYNQNGICVMYCSSGFADPTAGFRACTSLCTQGLYGDPVSGRCLASCLPGYYAFNDTNLCVTSCPNGYADNSTGVCVAICPAPTFADSLNNKCMRICSNGQYGQGRVCVPSCTDPLYGNPLTMECQSSCPDFDYTFAQNTSNLCVKNCSVVPNSYADSNNNYCMDECTQQFQYALDNVAICTKLCPQGQFMDNSTHKCQGTCQLGYAQPTSRYCVARCLTNPQTFAHIPSLKCVYKCKTPTQNLYADNSTNICVAFDSCNRTLNYFSDPISGHCVAFCPEGLYAENTTWTCMDHCVTGFADNYTRKCVIDCPPSQQTYGDPVNHVCVKVCPDGWVAENSTQRCVRVNACPPNTWSDTKSKHCVSRCPSQPVMYGYDGTTSCVSRCPSSAPELYGDNVTQKCIYPCTDLNGERRFADPISQTCVLVCPITQGLFGDPTTGKCTNACDAANPYKDNSTQRCVAVCPSNPDYYAYITDKVCVRVCPAGLYASDPTTRICTSSCATWSTFRDTTTNRCVSRCPAPNYADDSIYLCVPVCPTTPDYYADNQTRSCVADCPDGPLDANSNPIWISWQEQLSRTCMTRCPSGQFAQNSSGRCVAQCPPNQYADPIIRVCVADCTVRPGYYKSTGPRTCVKDCPTSPMSYKYQPTHTCVNMSGTLSGCITPYYADQLTSACTTFCPNGYYADDHTRFCRLNCTNGQFADKVSRKCLTGCTTSPNWFAYTVDMTCVPYCPSPFFSQNVTYTCTTGCPTLANSSLTYSYTITRQCVVMCPAPFYAYDIDKTCVTTCPSTYFAIQATRRCQQTCPSPLYADDSTWTCVLICPTTPNYFGYNRVCIPGCPGGTFKDNSTRTCVTQCPFLPLTFADDTTNQCVYDCPSAPNYFADNETRTCTTTCSAGTFAQVTTRTCVQNCPTGTYADPNTGVCAPTCTTPNYASDLTNQCVGTCPHLPVLTYADVTNGRKCVPKCPTPLFGNNDTLSCQADCTNLANSYSDITTNLCVTTCPIGFFAHDASSVCRRDCQGTGQFADSTTRKCVTNCPGTQRLYADTTTSTCVSICPVSWYGDSQSWQCKTSCPSASAGYVLQVSRTCVPQCPPPYFALVSQRLCVQNCGAGVYGNPVTRQCAGCPSVCLTCVDPSNCITCTSGLYLQYGACVTQCTITPEIALYANNIVMKCVTPLRCQASTFGYNGTKSCEPSCPTQMYGNSTTRTCQNCPSTCTACTNSTHCTACITNAQLSLSDAVCYPHCSPTMRYSYNGVCYSSCPPGTFIDFTNVKCQACNAICLTCVGTSLNCTTCDGLFYFNNSCITRCPIGYFGNNSQCIQCTPDIPSCSQPLTFQTTSVVQNYQQVVIIKFNQQAIIKGKPQDFMKINLQMSRRRRMQDVATIVNNGLTFSAVVLPDGTIKLYLEPGLSLNNVKYTISFTDPSMVTTATGASLQNLQGLVQLTKAEVYPDTYTYNAPLVVVGKIMAIIMLVLTFVMLIFGLTPLYLMIEAVQFMSLFAYTYKLAPNLFYFLKELRLSRFVFMPNIFKNVYIQPQGFVEKIPTKVVDTQGQLSFAINGTSFFFFVIFYLIMSAFVYLLTTKLNTNRPLKNLFIRVWQTRIKFGVLHDFLWLFAVNMLTQAFMQFRYTQNGGDLGFGIVMALGVLALIFGLFGYGVKKWREDPSSIADNYSLYFEGSKDQWYHKFFFFIYYFRKILFAVTLVGTVFNTLAMAGIMLTIFALVGLAVILIRPYQQMVRNVVLLVNEGFLGFYCGGVIYFLRMIDREQPSGAKITNGYILTIVIIIHFCLLMAWSMYRSYMYLKDLREQFMKSEFYHLYMDEEYDAILEKQISQLNQDEKGEIQSIQVTNVASNDGQVGQEDQIIKLKIKRRIKKQKLKKQVEDVVGESKQQSRIKGQYLKIQEKNQNYYKLKPTTSKQYEKMIFDSSPSDRDHKNADSPIQESKENDWVKVEKPEQQVKKKNQEVHQAQGYKQAKVDNFDNIFQQEEDNIRVSLKSNKSIPKIQIKPPKAPVKQNDDYSSILFDSEDEEVKKNREQLQQQKKKKDLQEMQRKMRDTKRSSLADFDESNFFEEPQNVSKLNTEQQKQEKAIKQPIKQQEIINSQSQAVNQIEPEFSQINSEANQNNIKDPITSANKQKQPSKQSNDINFRKQSQIKEQQRLQQQFQNRKQQPQQSEEFRSQYESQKPIQQSITKKVKIDDKQDKYQEINSVQQSEDILANVPQQNLQDKQEQKYKIFNFDEMNIEEQPEQNHQKEQEKKQQPQKNKNNNWNIEIQDLLADESKQDEQTKKAKEKSKKMHLMLFEDDQDDK